METAKIVQFINEDLNLGLLNWRVEAKSGDHRQDSGLFARAPEDGSVVTIKAKWTNVDTGIEYADEGYPVVHDDLTRCVVIKSHKLTDEDAVLHEVHNLLVRAFSHEVLEGMRVRSRGNKAPFHPHRVDGLRASDEEFQQIAFLKEVRPVDLTPAMVRSTRDILSAIA